MKRILILAAVCLAAALVAIGQQYGQRNYILRPDLIGLIGHDGRFTAGIWNFSVPAPNGGSVFNYALMALYNEGVPTVTLDASTGAVTGKKLRAAESTWNGGHLELGPYHLWIDAEGRLRSKHGAPTWDLDGVVVGQL
jgi:hypothetical protein